MGARKANKAAQLKPIMPYDGTITGHKDTYRTG